MNGPILEPFEDDEANIDLRRFPVDQVCILFELVRFDRFLEYVYAILLKREPDREGRAHYLKLILRGVTRPTIVRSLMRSREYRASSVEADGLTIEEFINRAYQDTLGRWPDQDGVETYRQIASRRNGRRKVIADLQASDEAVRKGGGRLARIAALRSYARSGWSTRLFIIGWWFARRRKRSRRLDQIALNQRLLAQQISALREELGDARMGGVEPVGFMGEARDANPADAIFQHALTRARRETQTIG